MIQWPTGVKIYLHKAPVDFRKAINGLSVLVSESMQRCAFDPALFVFCNRRRDQLKVLYWDQSGFALWQKRLEKEKFKWPRDHRDTVIVFNDEQWQWLLRGLDIRYIQPHKTLKYQAIC